MNFRSYPEIGITEGHLGLSHQSDNPVDGAVTRSSIPTRPSCLRRSSRACTIPTATAPLLDHSLLLLGAGEHSNLHTRYDLPLTVFGGGFKGGRHVAYLQDTSMTNLLLRHARQGERACRTLEDSSGTAFPSFYPISRKPFQHVDMTATRRM